MITSDDFIWLHFPKCAGTRIETIFQRYFTDDHQIHQDPVGLDLDPTIGWHDSIQKRIKKNPEFSLGNRVVICSFRRLPGWLISRYNFEVRRSPELPHKSSDLLVGNFLEQNGMKQHADAYIDRYLTPLLAEQRKIKYLRVEHFRTDFITIFKEFINVSRIPFEEFDQYENKTLNILPDELLMKISEEKEVIYSHCPKWRHIEQLAYPQALSGVIES